MRKTKLKTTGPAHGALTTLQPNAAGADISAREIYVAVPPDRDASPVRCFGTFTDQLRALVEWLRECRIDTLAMEATGVYWIPLAEMLEEAGIAVSTIEDYVRRIRAKYARAGRPAVTKVDLYKRAVEDGFLPPPNAQ